MVANDSPVGIKALLSGPDMMSTFAAKFSPSLKVVWVVLISPEDSYWMYNVRLPLSEFVELNIFTIVALTPDVSPTILRFKSWSIYDSTVIPRYSLFISTQSKLSMYDVFPGITFDPSLKKCWPNFAIWFCNIYFKPVNSLACRGTPGLNNTL